MPPTDTPTPEERWEQALELAVCKHRPRNHAPYARNCSQCVIDQIRQAEQAGYSTASNEVAEWIIGKGHATGHGDTITDMLDEAFTDIEQAGYERCESFWQKQYPMRVADERLAARREAFLEAAQMLEDYQTATYSEDGLIRRAAAAFRAKASE